jgi:hypothetical protein
MGSEPQPSVEGHEKGVTPLPDQAPVQGDHRLGSLLEEIPERAQGGTHRRSGHGMIGGHNLCEVASELLLPDLNHRRVQPLLCGMVPLAVHRRSARLLALKMALAARRPEPGLMHHSDQGV